MEHDLDMICDMIIWYFINLKKAFYKAQNLII